MAQVDGANFALGAHLRIFQNLFETQQLQKKIFKILQSLIYKFTSFILAPTQLGNVLARGNVIVKLRRSHQIVKLFSFYNFIFLISLLNVYYYIANLSGI